MNAVCRRGWLTGLLHHNQKLGRAGLGLSYRLQAVFAQGKLKQKSEMHLKLTFTLLQISGWYLVNHVQAVLMAKIVAISVSKP